MKPQLTDTARATYDRLFSGSDDELAATDPEFFERYVNFAFDQVPSTGSLSDDEPLPKRTRFLAVLAFLIGCQGIDEFRVTLPAALNAGVSPTEVKETVYQATAYLGMGRVRPFFGAMNDVLRAHGIKLPLEGQATTEPTYESRAVAGEAKQVAYFGEQNRGFAANGNPEYPHINQWLSSHCFGDWYTRGGLTDQEREMITLCFLAAQGGCEPQLTAHARANMNIGNTKALLLKVVSAGVPYLGYPRTLNAIRCIEDAA